MPPLFYRVLPDTLGNAKTRFASFFLRLYVPLAKPCAIARSRL